MAESAPLSPYVLSRPAIDALPAARVRESMRALVVFPAALNILLVVGLIAAFGFWRWTARWVDHTDEVIAQAHYVQRLLIDEETGLRGFEATGRAAFLEPWEKASSVFAAELLRLERLVSDNPPQGARVRELKARHDAWAELVPSFRTYPRTARSVELDAEGKRQMDEMREVVAAFITVEQELRATRAGRSEAAGATTIAAIVLFALGAGIAMTRVSRAQVAFVASRYEEVLARLQQLTAHLEEMVRQRTAELSVANRELEAFSYSVSHDLRAPLRVAEGFSHALEEDFGDRLNGAAREYLQDIRGAMTRMGQLIDDLLMLSRVSRAPLERTEIDLSAMAERVVQRLHASAPSRSVECTIEPGLLDRADPRLIEIALDNLLGNAWKFTGKREKAHVRFGRRQGSQRPPVYEVIDDGAGFDMAYANKLFTPFQRLHTESEFPGTGIGLATVRRIIERHGGTLEARGTPGEGAAISFSLWSSA